MGTGKQGDYGVPSRFRPTLLGQPTFQAMVPLGALYQPGSR
ncbi:hypothetical protein FBZ87_10126 [Nitrospirillum amazonense]|uniref:Uncharacterized protein n=1 Tax=Nitrospirillum amazonense TaxID=28077 RepID=A0A560KG74_9PROT|nr:hypothetical protein FBZ87_10126 [Nitrospirillum amazonense]